MYAELRIHEWRGKPIKETTVQKYLTTVSTVLRDAKKNEVIQKNPVRTIDLPSVEHMSQAIPTDKQANEIFSCVLSEAQHYKTFYALAMYTGFRRGELCALPGCGVVEGRTKNGKARTIILGEAMTNILRSYCFLKSQQAEENSLELSEYIFTDVIS